jgi:hypothetical protein
MKKISIVVVASLSLAVLGCSKKKGADCDKAIAHSMEVSKADMAKMGVDDKMMAKMQDLGVKHCKEDKWPDEAIACMTNAKDEATAQGCYGKLTADQRDKMNKAAMELAPAAPAGSAATAPGSATGSDTGAAGSATAGSGSAEAGSATAGSATTGSAGSAATPPAP